MSAAVAPAVIPVAGSPYVQPVGSGVGFMGPTLVGGSSANGDITIEGTSHATKATSYVLLQPSGGLVGAGFSAPEYIFHVRSTLTQIGVDYSSTKRSSIFTDADGAINVCANTYVTQMTPTHIWAKYDTARASGVILVDSQGDFNYYYAGIGTEDLAKPALVRFTGVNGGTGNIPQVIISKIASTTNHGTAFLYVHGDNTTKPLTVITNTTTTPNSTDAFFWIHGNSTFRPLQIISNTPSPGTSHASSFFDVVGTGAGLPRMDLRTIDNLASNTTGPQFFLTGSDDAGNSNKTCYLQIGRYTGFTTTLHAVLATTTPGGLVFSADNATAQLSLLTTGNVGIATRTFGTSAAKVLGIGNGTEPSTSPADMVQLYSVDLSAGNATLGLRTETAVAADVGLASTHSLTVRINGTSYKIPLVA